MPSIHLTAPIGGWNTVSALHNMPPEDAPVLTNWIPRATSCTSRPGNSSHSSALGGSVESMMTYHGSTEQMLCAANGKLINITAGGSGTNLATGLTNDRWYTAEFKDRLLLGNGADAIRDWDGTTLTSTSISGATATALVYPHVFKGRVYWTEINSQSFWYAGAGAYAGAYTEYDLSQFSTRGGYLLYTASMTRDGGDGHDDLFCAVFDTGEVLVYAGDDPGSTTAWAMIGSYDIAPPLGRRSSTRLGGDLAIITQDGYIPLSEALLEGRYADQSALSFKIGPSAKDAATRYSSNYGWQIINVPELSLTLVNVPLSSTQSVQHVRDNRTGNWCKFTGWDAASFTRYGGDLYFGGTDGVVYKVGSTADNGGFIDLTAVQAYNHFSLPHQKKQVLAARPRMTFSHPRYVDYRFYADYNAESLPTVTAPPESAPSDWDVGQWNTMLWEASSDEPKVGWKQTAALGEMLAPVVRLKSRAQQIVWYSHDILFKEAGII